MNKESISKNYIENMKEFHARKIFGSDRRALITGAERSGSIGEAIFLELQRHGITSHLYGRDVRDEYVHREQCEILIICHGVTHLDWLEDAPLEKTQEIVDVNLTATIKLVQSFVKATVDGPYRKVIVMIGSMAYRSVLNGSAAYCASKAGLAHFARCAAWELAPKGYDVYIVHPSNTEGTPMTEETIQGLMRYRNLSRFHAEAYWGASLPRECWLQPGDIAEVVLSCVNGIGGGYLSGTQIDLGGGQR